MNKKGFLSTTIVYSFFLVFSLSMIIYFVHQRNLNIQKDKNINKIKEELIYEDNLTGFAKLIVKDNGGSRVIIKKGFPNFNAVSSKNEGMLAIADNYGTSFYFRGRVDNNWVFFGGFYWRIVRVNGDGSIRLIYSGEIAPTSSEAIVMTGLKTEISPQTKFNELTTYAEYLGYMYTLGERRGFSTSSLSKTILENWYLDNLLDYDNFISDTLFCVDRTTYVGNAGGHTYYGEGYGTTPSAFSAVFRLYGSGSWNNLGSGPSLKCSHQEDRFTVLDTTIGNARLAQKIGLLTADEAVLSGVVAGTFSSNHEDAKNIYLYTNRNFWLISPGGFDELYQGTFYITDNGYANFNWVNIIRSLRPVINLISNVDVVGNGTYYDPYTVITSDN